MDVHEERVAARLAKAQAQSEAARTSATPATASNTEPARNTEEERVVDLESEGGEEEDFREVSEGYNGSEDEFDARVRVEE